MLAILTRFLSKILKMARGNFNEIRMAKNDRKNKISWWIAIFCLVLTVGEREQEKVKKAVFNSLRERRMLCKESRRDI